MDKNILPLGFFSLLFSGKTLICMSLIVIKAVVSIVLVKSFGLIFLQIISTLSSFE